MATLKNALRRPPEGPQRQAQPSFEDLAVQYLKGLGYRVSHGTPNKSYGDFLQCVKDVRDDAWWHLTTKGNEYGRKYTTHQAKDRIEKVYGTGWVRTKAAMGENQGTTGGYTVPPEYSTLMLDTVAERSFIWPRATVLPMGSAELNLPVIDAVTATTTAGVPSFFGSVQFKWGSEQAAQETEPKFRQVNLRAWDLLGYSVASNDWLGDTGPAGEEALIKLFGKAAAWYIEYAFLVGTGSGGQMPLGVVKSPCAIYTGNSAGKTGRQTASTITIGDITVMTSQLLPYSWQNAIWACSPDALTPIQQLSSYFVNIELGDWTHRQVPKPVGMLSTLPLFVTEKLSVLGAPGDLVLFDPSLYIIGDRQQVIVDVSEHVSFQNNQTNFRVWVRVDGKPLLSNKVTLQDTVRTVSPVVVLN